MIVDVRETKRRFQHFIFCGGHIAHMACLWIFFFLVTSKKSFVHTIPGEKYFFSSNVGTKLTTIWMGTSCKYESPFVSPVKFLQNNVRLLLKNEWHKNKTSNDTKNKFRWHVLLYCESQGKLACSRLEWFECKSSMKTHPHTDNQFTCSFCTKWKQALRCPLTFMWPRIHVNRDTGNCFCFHVLSQRNTIFFCAFSSKWNVLNSTSG